MSAVAEKRDTDLPELPEGWRWSTLGEISSKPQYGWTTKADHESGEIKLLRTTDITSGDLNWSTVPYCTEVPDDLEKYKVKEGDIFISRAGSVGFSYLLKTAEPAVFASYLIRFRFDGDINRKYVYYFLKSPSYWLSIGASASGIAVQNVNATKLAAISVPIAPRDQQDRIVAEIEKQFSRLDEAVASLKRVKANLKRYKAAVLKAAVEGKLTEEWRKQNPDVEPASKLLERILAERRKKWEDAELAKMKAKGKEPKNDKWKEKYKEPALPDDDLIKSIPNTWATATLDALCPIFFDSPHRTPKYAEEGYPALRPRDVVNGHLDLVGSARVSREEYDTQTKRYAPSRGDIVYSRELSFGWGANLPASEQVCLSQGMCVFRPHDGIVTDYFVYQLNGLNVRQQAEKAATGSAHPHINLGDIKSYTFLLSPNREQEEIVLMCGTLLSNMTAMEKAVSAAQHRAVRLRQSILSSAFAGEMAVTSAVSSG